MKHAAGRSLRTNASLGEAAVLPRTRAAGDAKLIIRRFLCLLVIAHRHVFITRPTPIRQMLSRYLVRLAASKVSASKYKLPTRRATTLDVPPQRTDNIFVHTLAPSRSRLLPAFLSLSLSLVLPPPSSSHLPSFLSPLFSLCIFCAPSSTLPLGSRPIARRLPYEQLLQ